LKNEKKAKAKEIQHEEIKKIDRERARVVASKDKVYWGDRIMGVGTVFISGVRE